MTGSLTDAPPARDRRRLSLQRATGYLLAPLTLPVAAALLRWGLGYRIENLGEVRREFRQIRTRSQGPLVIGPNHRTMIDSVIIAWAFASPLSFLLHFAWLPWNLPERSNFASSFVMRCLVYVFKCLPIERGGSREEVAAVMACFAHLLRQGEVCMIFPEGGRSRTGRVELDSAAYGVGRLIRSVPGCRVLCVYMRGEDQRAYSDIPARGESFRLALTEIEPKTDHRGLRASRDIARQIVQRLIEMERDYFDDRE